MGKNHRHKKNLKAEKAKVKLKQTKTKFLPKGLNVTDTNFKIKSIILPEQLKQKDLDAPLSKRKLNLKDLLSRIKHYNENVRLVACEELSDMIKIHPQEIINEHLSLVIPNVCTLMQDRESKVRKAAVKVVYNLLETTSNQKLDPFFNYFSTNLRCAMTNIDKRIQEDSLLFLDCFLRKHSTLVSKSSEKILPDFFTLISKLRNDSQPGRTLTVSLGSKMTSVTWRIKVLSRLHAVLETVLNERSIENNCEVDVTENIIDASKCQFVPIYKDSFCKKLKNSARDIFSNHQKAGLENDVLNRHIVMLVPLLYETWIEVVPEKKISKAATEVTNLNEETAAILTCVMKTLYLLWKYVKKNQTEEINEKSVFLSTEGRRFLGHILSNFPYNQPARLSQKQSSNIKLLQGNLDPRCVVENLLVCFIFSVLNVGSQRAKLKTEMTVIVAYLSKCLLTPKYVNHSNVKYLVQILKICLIENPLIWKRSGVDLVEVLDNTVTFYQSTVNEGVRMEIFDVLSKIINVSYLNESPNFQVWLSHLPNLLLQPSISDSLVNCVLDLSTKNNKIFREAFVKIVPQILENLPKINITLSSRTLLNNEDAVKRKIVYIFYFQRLNDKNLSLIKSAVENGLAESFSNCFEQVLCLEKG